MSDDQQVDFWSLWKTASDDARFRYRLNRRFVGFFVGLLVIIWGYFIATWIHVGSLTLSLGGYVAVYGLLTVVLGVLILRWRAFCVMSGVLVFDDRLVWNDKGTVTELLWDDLTMSGVQLSSDTEDPTELRSHIALKLPDGTTRRLQVTVAYAWLENVELLLGAILSRATEGGPGDDGAPKPPKKSRSGAKGLKSV